MKPTFSFSVTAHNEMTVEKDMGKRLQRCLRAALEHPGINEVVVVDDGSDHLMSDIPGVQLYRNQTNLGMFLNKLESIINSSCEWVICCDSDNIKDASHIDKVLSMSLDPDIMYCPSFARPRFDYRRIIGTYDLKNIWRICSSKQLSACLNTGNQVLHRESFLNVFGKYWKRSWWLDMWRCLDVPKIDRSNMHWRSAWDANDSLLYNMLWLYDNKRLEIVSGLEHKHYTGAASTYLKAPKEKLAIGRCLLRELENRSRLYM
jgi:glycosyltransferase involved in cell wall biosynthesis